MTRNNEIIWSQFLYTKFNFVYESIVVKVSGDKVTYTQPNLEYLKHYDMIQNEWVESENAKYISWKDDLVLDSELGILNGQLWLNIYILDNIRHWGYDNEWYEVFHKNNWHIPLGWKFNPDDEITLPLGGLEKPNEYKIEIANEMMNLVKLNSVEILIEMDKVYLMVEINSKTEELEFNVNEVPIIMSDV